MLNNYIKLIIFAVLLIFLPNCVATVSPNFGKLTLASNKMSEKEIKNIYNKYQVPIIIIGDGIYIPSKECIDSRNSGGGSESRNLGGGSESRNLGGGSESRNLGGGSENRNLGGDSENRNLGGDSESRNLGGDSENRNLGGDSENRNLGGDSENRNLGGDSENRNLGGDSESRNLGGDSGTLKCIKLRDNSGFKIINFENRKIKYFDGIKIRTINNGEILF